MDLGINNFHDRLLSQPAGPQPEGFSLMPRKRITMNTSDVTDNNANVTISQRQIKSLYSYRNEFCDQTADDVYVTITSSPLCRLLGLISSLPEIRHEKVNDVRRQIDLGEYNISDNLDLALDKVLEEFIAD